MRVRQFKKILSLQRLQREFDDLAVDVETKLSSTSRAGGTVNFEPPWRTSEDVKEPSRLSLEEAQGREADRHCLFAHHEFLGKLFHMIVTQRSLLERLDPVEKES